MAIEQGCYNVKLLKVYMRRILLVLIAVCGLFAKEGIAQDPQFSQFYAAPLYINPAFTGASEYTRFGVNYRNQWPSLNPAANFVTFSFYADHYLPNANSGIGMIVTTDREGTQGLQSTSIGLSYAYQLKLSDNLVFRPGLNVSYTTRDANFSNLIFASQIDPVNGFDPTLPGDPAVGANANLNASFVDISAGGIFYSRNLYLGFAAHHINEPDQSILELSDTPSNLPMRVSIHGGYKITIGKGPLRKDLTYTHAERSITPVFQYKSQGPFDILDVGAYLHLEPVNLGVWYRGYPLKKFTSTNAVGDPQVFPQNEALIFSIGVTTSDFNIGYSYDYTLSELGVASGGAHEFSISYYLNFKKPQRVPRDQWKIPCPKN